MTRANNSVSFGSIVAATLLAACVNLDPLAHEVKVEAGPMPSQAAVDRVIKSYLDHSLKDPDSIKQYRFISLHKTRWLRGSLNGGGSEEGWLACFEYNAKNSYGGYTGVKTQGLVMRSSDGSDATIIGHAMSQIMRPTC
jgi:hypothetical protein